MPINLALLTAMAKNDAPPEVIADMLTDGGADISEVLHLYAGAPPNWEAGLRHEMLVAWLEAQGEPRAAKVKKIKVPASPKPRFEGGANDVFLGYGVRFGAIRCQKCPAEEPKEIAIGMNFSESIQKAPDGRHFGLAICVICRTVHWGLPHNDPERREQKWRTLQLFPDVQVTNLVACCSCKPSRNAIFPAWFGRCDKCHDLGFTRPGGTVAANQLIPKANK